MTLAAGVCNKSTSLQQQAKLGVHRSLAAGSWVCPQACRPAMHAGFAQDDRSAADGLSGGSLKQYLNVLLTVLGFCVVQVMGMVFESLGQPVINGYLVAGAIVGPGGLQLIKELVQVRMQAGRYFGLCLEPCWFPSTAAVDYSAAVYGATCVVIVRIPSRRQLVHCLS